VHAEELDGSEFVVEIEDDEGLSTLLVECEGCGDLLALETLTDYRGCRVCVLCLPAFWGAAS